MDMRGGNEGDWEVRTGAGKRGVGIVEPRRRITKGGKKGRQVGSGGLRTREKERGSGKGGDGEERSKVGERWSLGWRVNLQAAKEQRLVGLGPGEGLSEARNSCCLCLSVAVVLSHPPDGFDRGPQTLWRPAASRHRHRLGDGEGSQEEEERSGLRLHGGRMGDLTSSA